MKIEKPRILHYTPADSLTACLEDDNYIEARSFHNIIIQDQDINTLHLDGCKFQNVRMENCHFDHIDIIDAIFENCELSNVHFNDGAIHRCCFKNCRCMGIDFADCTLHNIRFIDLNARYANMSGSKFKQVIFQNLSLIHI